uniref:Uncharacterized protein n=1 Tax=Oryza nivara TaxID=4536 RepID=A0A0E0G5S4_ORYNI
MPCLCAAVPSKVISLAEASIWSWHLREARPTVVYSSDLKRAAETAEIIEKACDVSNIVLTEALRERHMGYLQGVFKGFANFEVKNGLDFDGRNQELPLLSYQLRTLNLEDVLLMRVIVVGYGAAILELKYFYTDRGALLYLQVFITVNLI